MCEPDAAATLGWQLSWVAPERGEIEVVFDARDCFANPMGNVQGGFLAAMLDDTLGPALAATLDDGEFAPTVELKDQAGELLATATATARIVRFHAS